MNTKAITPVSAQEKTLIEENNPQRIFQQEQIIPFPERLKEAIGNNSIRSLASKCELDPKTLRNYLSGKQYPTLDRLASIADASGRSINWLATGETNTDTITERVENDGNVSVPEYDVQASAGGGSFVGNEVKIGEFSFPESWLRQKRLYGYDLCVISAWGESMEPSIQHKDSLLISLLDKSEIAAYDGVYILRLDGLLLVKRMKYDMEGRGHHIISDNPLHGSTFISNAEFDDRVVVVGTVVGIVYKQISQPASQED